MLPDNIVGIGFFDVIIVEGLYDRNSKRSSGTYVKETISNNHIQVEAYVSVKVDERYLITQILKNAIHSRRKLGLSENSSRTCTISCSSAMTSQGEVCTAVTNCPGLPDIDEKSVFTPNATMLTAITGVHVHGSQPNGPTASVRWDATIALGIGGSFTTTITPEGVEVQPNWTTTEVFHTAYNNVRSWHCDCGTN